MTFQDFCSTLAEIEKTTLGLEMTRLLASLFKSLEKDEIEPACWLLLGRLGPLYENIEFNFAEKMIMRALAEFVEKKVQKKSAAEQLGLLEDENKIERQSEVLASFKVSGDLGDTTEKLFETIGKKHDIRSITSVYQDLLTIAKEFGNGSQDRKIRGVILVLQECTAQTAKYIVRIVFITLKL